LPSVAKYILSLDTVKRFVFPLVSQIGINYRHSSLSQHAGDENFRVKAGDRMPYFLVDGESVYDRLRQPKFHLLIFSDGQSGDQGLKEGLEQEYANWIDLSVIRLQPQAAEIFGTDQPFSLLLRPDNYIGFISPKTSLGEMRIYLAEFTRRS